LINYKYVGLVSVYYKIVVRMGQNDMFVYFTNAFGQTARSTASYTIMELIALKKSRISVLLLSVVIINKICEITHYLNYSRK